VLLSAPLEVAGEDTETSVDAIATAISGALGPEVAKAERERAARRPVADASVHELVRRGMWHRHRETREDLAAAEALFAQAVEAEPRNALALSAWSIARNFAAIRGWPQDVPAAFREAMALARRALEADPRDPQAHFAVGLGHMNLGQREEAVAAFEDVIRLNPSFAGARANLGQMLNYLDRPEEAMAHLQLAFRLSPHDPFGYQWLPYIAASHYLSARYRDCLAAARQALEARPSYPLAIRYAVAAMGQLGRTEGVEPLLAEMRRVDIDLAHLSVHARRMFVPSAANRLIEGFAKAGFA
jgi:tetratricopeptide (TPR) repeat protein